MEAQLSDGKVQSTIHIAWNINLLKRMILADKTGDGFITNKNTGKDLPKKDALKELNKLQKQGYKVVPPCDNIKADGTCKGHKA